MFIREGSLTTDAEKGRSAEAKGELRHRGWAATAGVAVRLLAALTGGVVLFAVWVAAVLTGMPRPPVPPSFAVTLTAPVVVAAGFALGLLVGERLTGRRRTGFLAPYLWALAGCLVGAVTMFPLGGMMAGFGVLALGPAALLVREALLRSFGGASPPSA